MRLLGTLAIVTVALTSGGCALVNSPFLPEGYASVAVGAGALDYEQGDQQSDFPLPFAEVGLGALVRRVGTTTTALEVGGHIFLTGPGGDLDGWGFKAWGGVRHSYRQDKRFRPSVTIGAGWAANENQGNPGPNDVRGPGGYVGGALDYMITPRLGIGVDARFWVLYPRGERSYDVVGSTDALVHLFYLF